MAHAKKSTYAALILLFFDLQIAAEGRRNLIAPQAAPPPDREPQTGHPKHDTRPVTAHQTFKNSSVYPDLSDSLGA
jgi:hypothetical protein